MVAAGLAAARSLEPGHGHLTLGAMARPDFFAATLGYEHAISQNVAAFARAHAGMAKVGGAWAADYGAVAGVGITW